MAVSPENLEHSRRLATVQDRIDRFVTINDSSVVLDPAVVPEMVALTQAAGGLFADTETAHTLGWLHWFRYLSLPEGSDQNELRAAMGLFARSLRAWPNATVPPEVQGHFGGPVAPAVLALVDQGSDLATASATASCQADSSALIDAAVDRLREALTAAPPVHPVRLEVLARLASALGQRFDLRREPADLDEAIAIGWDVARATPPDDPTMATVLSNLGTSLRVRSMRNGDEGDLENALRVGRAAVVATAADHPQRGDYMMNFVLTLHIRARRGGGPEALTEAVRLGREVVGGAPLNHPRRGHHLVLQPQ